jgi:hypothetical protein
MAPFVLRPNFVRGEIGLWEELPRGRARKAAAGQKSAM